MKILARIALLLVLAGLSTGAAQAAGGVAFVDRVGLLQSDNGDACVATLLRGDVALTAAHCLFDQSMATLRLDQLRFLLEPEDVDGVPVVDVSVPVGFDPTAGATPDAIVRDLSLVRLGWAVGELSLPPRGRPVLPGDLLALFRAGSAVPVSCAVVAVDGELFTLDCQVSLGDSGAPLTREWREVTELVGIVSAFEAEDAAYTAIAVEIGDGIERLLARLKAR